jgi:uncharacterized protein
MTQHSGPVVTSAPLAPVAPGERIPVLDVLRGFALLGIIVMNMGGFSMPGSAGALDPRLFPGFADRAAEFFMTTFFAGKANSIFSFLFGLGLTIQMQRAEARGQRITALYLRRLFVLLLVGAAHGILLWDGDVLHVYAVLGLLLLAMRRAPNKLIFGVIALCLVAPVLRGGVALYTHEKPLYPVQFWVDLAHQHMRIFQQGTYAQQLAARLEGYERGYGMIGTLRGHMWTYVSFSVTMLLGFYTGKMRILSDIAKNAPRLRKLTAWCLGFGVATATIMAILSALHRPTNVPTVRGFFLGLLFNVNRPLLCIAYIGAIALLLQSARFQRLLLVLANPGQMPLTNYLMQSVMATTIFYPYGFGLYGRVGPLLGLLVSVAIFGVQVVYSKWWLAHFQYGPLEWLWRAVTYGKLPPMRVTSTPAAAVVAPVELPG